MIVLGKKGKRYSLNRPGIAGDFFYWEDGLMPRPGRCSRKVREQAMWTTFEQEESENSPRAQ